MACKISEVILPSFPDVAALDDICAVVETPWDVIAFVVVIDDVVMVVVMVDVGTDDDDIVANRIKRTL